MKYVLFERPDSTCFPVVFPDFVGHDFIRDNVHARYPGITPVAAGFCSVTGVVWGKSVSLNLVSRKEDEFYLNRLFNVEY